MNKNLQMKVVLIGATGATGYELLKLMLADEAITEVVVLLRKALKVSNPKLKVVMVNFDQLSDWASEIKGDIAISCLGTTLKDAGSKEAQYKVDFQYQYEFAKLAKANHISKFLLISASNADASSLFFYSKIKGLLENAIEDLNFQSFVIFRPGPLVRPNSNRTGEKIGVSIIGFLNKLGILNNFKPLPVKKLADLMLNYAKNSKAGKIILSAHQILSESK